MSQSKCNMFYTPAASGCSPLPILERMSQAKFYICMLLERPSGHTPQFKNGCLKRHATFFCCGGARVAASTNFKHDVSSEMLLAYVADESYSPILPTFRRMPQTISHICMLRVPRTRSSNKMFITCPSRKATCSIRPQLPDAHRCRF